MARFLAILFLLFANSVFSQEKVPKLPDYTKWDTDEQFHLSYFVVKEDQIELLDLEFDSPEDSNLSVMVVFKPVSQQTSEYLSTLVRNSPPSESINKTVISLAGKEPWLLVYFHSSDHVYLYERTSKWFECYYFWKPRWRFVRSFDDDCTDGSCTAGGEYEKFFENRYGLEVRY